MSARNNHVMHAAFGGITVNGDTTVLVGRIMSALIRNKPSTFGGWRVTNRRGRNVKRRR